MIDLSKIKPGDEVMVRAKVSGRTPFDDSACLYVEISENCQGYVGRSAIVSHVPKALAVGDSVRVAGAIWPIVAICNGWAWLGDTYDSGILRRLSALERAS